MSAQVSLESVISKGKRNWVSTDKQVLQCSTAGQCQEQSVKGDFKIFDTKNLLKYNLN